MKKSKKVTTVETVVEETAAPVIDQVVENKISQPNAPAEASADTTTEEAPKRLGRPVVEGSKRQLAIQERERKLAAGELKRGRKANPDSKRQAHLAHLAQLKAEGRLTGKKGRPVIPDSKHQKALAEKQARIINNGGVPLKPGRPKVVKAEVATTEIVDVS